MTENLSLKDDFQQNLLISVVFHIVVLLLFNFNFYGFNNENLEIKNSIRVDIVALPDKVPETQPAPPAAKPKPKVKLKPKKKPKTKNLKNAQAAALAKLKQNRALEKLKEQQRQKRAQEEAAKKQEEQQFKGNVINDGNSLEGLDRLEMTRYYESLRVHINKFWFLPQWLDELNLKGQALIRIDHTGYVIFKSIYTPSGNGAFDNAILSTIDKASPLPRPPGRLAGALKNKGFVLRFPN